jgi:hypothetical protein
MKTLDNHPTRLDLAKLPGADTSSKQRAVASTDPRLQAMLAEAARTGWPERFENDLYRHDLGILEAHPGEPMVWILRDNGTNLFPVHADSSGAAHYARAVLRYWSGEDKLNFIPELAERPRFYLVGLKGIQETTAAEAAAAIVGPPPIEA